MTVAPNSLDALMNRVVEDEEFRDRFFGDPRGVAAEEGYDIPESVLAKLEETPSNSAEAVVLALTQERTAKRHGAD